MGIFFNAVRLAFGAIGRNKLRACLTVLGVLIGVWAVVTVVALAEGATDKVGGELDGFAANAIYVYPQDTQQSGARAKATGRLTENDARAITREAVSVGGVGVWLDSPGQVVNGDRNVLTSLIGTNLAYFPIRKWEIGSGTFWTENDEIFKTKVCVIGETVRTTLFGDEDPVGATIRLAGFPYRIIGVLKARGASMMMGDDQDNRIVMPIGSFRARIQHTSPGRVSQLILGATSADTVDRAVAQVTSILRQRHRIARGAPDDFGIHTQAAMRENQGQITGIMGNLLMGVAAISLLVGGIGVMNIMLVSVAERTREIGIRMSIGAREGDILTQFLVEAVVLSCVGGLAGMILGIGVTAALASTFNLPLHAGLGSILMAMGTSAAIGLVFGFLPARRAAKLDPIDALRTE